MNFPEVGIQLERFPVVLDGFGVTVQFRETFAGGCKISGILRLEAVSVVKVFQRGQEFFLREMNVAQFEPGISNVGTESERFLEGAFRFRGLALFGKHTAETEPAVVIMGEERTDLQPLGSGCLEVTDR